MLSPNLAPIGFVLKAPKVDTGLHLLIDRSGLVLARCRTWQECVAVLGEHLATFVPPPANTVRVHMRAIIRKATSGRDAILAIFPLLSIPPLIERQLERRSQAIVDRLAVDISPDCVLDLAAMPWPELLTGAQAAGHIEADPPA